MNECLYPMWYVTKIIQWSINVWIVSHVICDKNYPLVDKRMVWSNKFAFFQNYLLNSLHWRHNDHSGVSNHQPRGCLLNRLFRRRSKETSKLRVTGLCVGNSPGPVNSPHKGPVTRKMLPFDDVIMDNENGWYSPPRGLSYDRIRVYSKYAIAHRALSSKAMLS